jgi:putative ABC transport system ATP-binding protein
LWADSLSAVTATQNPPPPAITDAAARTVDACKVYGAGDTLVNALDHVTVEFERGKFTAIMGPSGSGKSTLMHCVAGLDTLTSGQIFIGDVDLSSLNERQLTRLRRDTIGFVFQSFNLVPTLTATENITLPMDLAGTTPDAAWVDTIVSTVPASSRVGSSSASPWPERWPVDPASCSPTNPPEISIHAAVARSSSSCAPPSTSSSSPS